MKQNGDDNPTIGIMLCSDIAKYSILNGNEQLFATKYKLYLPTEEELRAEIEAQKAFDLIFNHWEHIEKNAKYVYRMKNDYPNVFLHKGVAILQL